MTQTSDRNEPAARVNASSGRYIKLGPQGKWEELCLSDGTLRLGFYNLPHELGIASDRDAIKAIYQAQEKTPGTISNYTGQYLDFYHLDEQTLWITFHRGHLYWCHAGPSVEYIGSDEAAYPNGSRLRRALKGWQRTSIAGKPLAIAELSGNLTKLAAYQQTICSIKQNELDYLLRKINDEDLPVVTEAKAAQRQMLGHIRTLLKLLTWQDFEVLVDLIFSQSGWRRIGRVGGDQKTVDLELMLPTTGEKAVVQVKSQTTQDELDKYITDFSTWGARRKFYAYHSSKNVLGSDAKDLTLMGPTELAEQVFQAGLTNWLIEKVA